MFLADSQLRMNNAKPGLEPNLQVERSYSSELIILVSLATLAFTLSLSMDGFILRTAYSLLLYTSVFLIGKTFFSASNLEKLKRDKPYGYFVWVFVLFVIATVIRDFMSPGFSLITLINNPLALLCVIPVFGFVVGVNTEDIDPVYKAINVLAVAFILNALLIAPTHEAFTHKVFTGFALPFAVFNLTLGKRKYLTLLIFAVAAWSSVVTDYRALFLRVLFFSILFISLNVFKRLGLVKLLIVATAAYFVFASLTDLSSFLNIFQSKANVSDSIGMDTRSFLYEEVFNDMRNDLVFGRGFLGTYFSPSFLQIHFDTAIMGDNFMRFSVEVGFLELLLKGGYVFVSLFLLPLVYVVSRGLQIQDGAFKLEYNICVYLLVELLMFFFENSPSYHIHFFMIFFLAGFVFNKIRQYEDFHYYSFL